MGGDALCFVALVLDSTPQLVCIPECIWHPSRLIMHECSCVAERVDVYNPDTGD